MDSNVSQRLREKLEARRAAEATTASPIAAPPTQPAAPPHDYMDCIPDLGDSAPRISPQEQVLDDFIARISIVEAYNQWAKKGFVDPKGRTESIKVRCPNPAHPDRNPSAWLNTDKNLFNCAQCGGGDVWDIAAWAKALPVPGYKQQPQTFRWLREQIGAEFGIVVEKGIAGDSYVVVNNPNAPQDPNLPAPETAPPQQQQAPVQVAPPATPQQAAGQQTQVATVTYLPAGAAAEEEYLLDRKLAESRAYPGIDWRSIVPTNTFLHAYLTATSVDDCPEEFHFWNGLLALGLAVGRCRTLEDSPQVVPNLFVCLTAATTGGKSKAKRHLMNLISEALPYKKDDQPPYGARRAKGVQSGEYLVTAFIHPMIDPSTAKPIPGKFFPVKALLDWEELADLIGRSNRQGSSLKDAVMELYDSPSTIASLSKTHGDEEAELPFGSILTTTQYESIRNLIQRSDASSGFANRWVYATGIAKRPFSINKIQPDLLRPAGLLGLIKADARVHELVRWDADAEKRWDEFFHEVVHPYKMLNQHSGVPQRIDLLLKKLFLLFTVNLRSTTLTKETVDAVITLFPHLTETYQIIDEQITATQDGDDWSLIQRTITRLSTNNGWAKKSDITIAVQKKIKASKLRKLLEDAVVLGLIDETKAAAGPGGGRPPTYYKLSNSAVAGGYSVS